MDKSIDIMVKRIASILSFNKPSVYLYGSVVLDDFRPGWSDIDILCLTDSVISTEQAEKLLNLRQTLSQEYQDNIYFKLFEGGFLSEAAYLHGLSDKVIYWGTTKQRITDSYILDPFSIIEILDSGKLLYGDDIRYKMAYPTRAEILDSIEKHYNIIRKYARETSGSIISSGWLLDISRCLYTLKTGKIIAKTAAGEWAMAEKIVPDIEVMKKAVEVRKNPEHYKNDQETLIWLSSLEPYIQRYADVLEAELHKEFKSIT